MKRNIDEKITELLGKMSVREKIGQLNMCCTPKTDEEFERTARKLRNGEIGSMILANSATAGNDPQERVNAAMTNRIQKIALEEGPHGIPIIFCRDVIHSHRTVYPVPLALCSAFNSELVKKAYRAIAVEAAAEGIHLTFAPMLDLCRDPRYGRIIEGTGEDPTVGAEMARAIVEGFQNGDVSKPDSLMTCAKHFVGYGASEGGRDYYRTEISPYSLYNYYLPAFKAAFEAGSDTVMASFNDINGEPVSGSAYYLKDILRDYLGFKGCVISDWGAIGFLKNQGVTANDAESAELALNAGIEIDMCDDEYIKYVEDLIKQGKISIDTLDEAVRHVLKIKFKKNLFENPYCKIPVIDRTEHIKLSRTVAQECMLLLKNEGDILPLAKNKKIALLGPMVHEKRALLGSWCLGGKAEETMSFYEAMAETVGSNNIITNADPTGLYDDSARVMYNSEVVILALGESEKVTGERRSMSDISLSSAQRELIHRAKCSGKKTVGVFFCGRPIAMEGVADLLDAVVYAWHSGTETARAACDILFGDAVPSGKTAITFPRTSHHFPIYYNATKNRYNCYYGNNSAISYEDSIAEPYYPFGYGLSYTKFEYSDISADAAEISLEDLKAGKKVTVSVSVKNIGNYDGKETVQLYIHDSVGKYMRPYRELKDFCKPFFKVGEAKRISFSLGYDKLGYYMPNGTYTVEKGLTEIFIGANCFADNKIVLKIV